MFTPTTIKLRKKLRDAICQEYPGLQPDAIFDAICEEKSDDELKVITIDDLERFCEKERIPAASLENILAPYGVRNDIVINKNQWKQFINDDFPVYKDPPKVKNLTDRQEFILSKFVAILFKKFGNTITQRWNSILSRNPPNCPNTTLRLSALCRVYQETNLPFDVGEFIDAIYVFYGTELDFLTLKQFSDLFNSFQ